MLVQNRRRQPDILEVISDLSNDEVFTPPRIANAMLDLLPGEVWSDPALRWLDPGCKTGVFPREITKRLMEGLADAIPDEDERLEHILHEMVFGIAVTSLTSLMSRRTVYCSKDASGGHSLVPMPTPAGNVWFGRTEHTFGRTGRCEECGASKKQFGSDEGDNHAYAFIHQSGLKALAKDFNMQFDVVIGNPPYQMTGGGGGTNDTAIYHEFVEQAIALDPRFVCMVIPSRWMAGGRGLDSFRETMLSGGHIRSLVDYPNSTEVFPTVDLKSGISYFLWDKEHQGTCDVTLIRGDDVHGPHQRQLDEHDIFVRDSRALGILKKVLAQGKDSLEDLVSGDTPFGLPSNFSTYRKAATPGKGEVRLFAGATRVGSMDPATVTKNRTLIRKWKVLIPKAGPGNSGGHVIPDMVLGQPLAVAPPSVCTQTYLTVGPVANGTEASNLESYLRTRFVRFLVSLRKVSQDAMRRVYRWVPQQDWSQEWTDELLFDKYGITDDERAYIFEMIREMPS